MIKCQTRAYSALPLPNPSTRRIKASTLQQILHNGCCLVDNLTNVKSRNDMSASKVGFQVDTIYIFRGNMLWPWSNKARLIMQRLVLTATSAPESDEASSFSECRGPDATTPTLNLNFQGNTCNILPSSAPLFFSLASSSFLPEYCTFGFLKL